MEAQIRFEKVLKPRKKELEGAESKLREKKDSKKLSRELQEAPKELEKHDPLSLSTDYKLPRGRCDPPQSPQRALEELLERQIGVRKGAGKLIIH